MSQEPILITREQNITGLFVRPSSPGGEVVFDNLTGSDLAANFDQSPFESGATEIQIAAGAPSVTEIVAETDVILQFPFTATAGDKTIPAVLEVVPSGGLRKAGFSYSLEDGLTLTMQVFVIPARTVEVELVNLLEGAEPVLNIVARRQNGTSRFSIKIENLGKVPPLVVDGQPEEGEALTVLAASLGGIDMEQSGGGQQAEIVIDP